MIEMRKITLFVITFCFTVSAFTQGGKIKKADKHFDSYSYDNAIEKYVDLEEKSPEINRRLAESYWNLHDYLKAEEYYALVVNQANAEPLDFYNYSEALKSNSKYLESEKWMDKYHSVAGHDGRAVKHFRNKGYAQKLLKDDGRYTIQNLDINSEQQDFGATYYKDKVVFASSREGTKPIERKWNWNGLPFLDMYVADKAADGTLSNCDEFHKKINMKYHEGPASFTDDGKLVVFTRNNYEGKDAEGVIKLQMYYAELEDEDWSEEKGIHFNSDQYSAGHPSLSPDGTFMYFTSDMPGGKGGTDIYKVARNEDGSWGKPENLGATINTEGNEMFPFYHPEGILVFASNGHPGLGGLDNFLVQVKENGFGKVINMGAPLNTNADDFSVSIDKDMKFGYVASNRIGGQGSDDIYSFELLKKFKFGKTIKGVASSKSGSLLDSTLVKLFNEAGEIVAEVITNDKGEYSFEVEPGLKFNLSGSRIAHFDGENQANTDTDEDVVIADLQLEKDPGLSVYLLITDKKTGEPLKDVKIRLTDNMTGDIIDILTPETGDWRKPLGDKRLKDRISYNLTIEREGYFSKTVTYNTELSDPGQYDIHKTLDLSLDVEVKDLSELVQINPINFDLNKYNIRPDAEVELNKIVEVMNKYPGMVVELGAHTDCRGSKAYNERLSDKRARASAAYIKTKITDPDRIYGKGYGESILLNDCACEGAVKSDCSDELHAENRRTEFKVISTGNDKVKVTNTSPDSF